MWQEVFKVASRARERSRRAYGRHRHVARQAARHSCGISLQRQQERGGDRISFGKEADAEAFAQEFEGALADQAARADGGR